MDTVKERVVRERESRVDFELSRSFMEDVIEHLDRAFMSMGSNEMLLVIIKKVDNV